MVLNKDRQHLSVLLDNIPETTTRGECSHCPQKDILQIKVVGGIFVLLFNEEMQWLLTYRKYPIYSHTLITYLKYDHNNRKVMQIQFGRKKGTLIITTLFLKLRTLCGLAVYFSRKSMSYEFRIAVARGNSKDTHNIDSIQLQFRKPGADTVHRSAET